MTLTLTDVLNGIVTTGLESLETNLGKVWDSLSPQEKDDCKRVVTTIGRARLEELAGKDISEYLPVLEGALLQWKAVGSGEVANALTIVGRNIAGMAGSFLVSALGKVLHG